MKPTEKYTRPPFIFVRASHFFCESGCLKDSRCNEDRPQGHHGTKFVECHVVCVAAFIEKGNPDFLFF